MQEKLIDKLNNDIKCELSIEEIKVLYGIDYVTNDELIKLSKKEECI